jgi:hypothetical protein
MRQTRMYDLKTAEDVLGLIESGVAASEWWPLFALGSFHNHPALRRKWSDCTPDLNRCVDRSSRCRAFDRP